jgi:alpha-glucuronidase
MLIDGFKTADPLEVSVKEWWKEKIAEIYSLIPDFGGFLVKADSEGEPGPFSYGRTPAQGANMIARALKPYGGILIWRAFVYTHNGTDRAAQAYNIFKPFDGKFEENAIIQIKNGPIDFQVREPVSPLFGSMPNTNQMLELQITQEYTGQATHLCYLVPEWKEILNFDTHAKGKGSTVSEIISGELTGQRFSGITGVSNIGSDSNWTGLLLAQSNTYGYGRLAWNPDLSSKEITDEWVKMTFGKDPEVVKTISDILLSSWKTYENYTSPLGVGIMCNGGGKYPHFLPAPEKRIGSSKADENGVGYDRTNSTGSGFVEQYFPPVREMYEDIKTCPEELLLFFHHVPYTYRLSSGETLIQYIYDSHFKGVEQVEQMKDEWETLRGKIDNERFREVLEKFDDQIIQARIWRDSINNFFYKMSGIPDQKGRLQEASGDSESLYTK